MKKPSEVFEGKNSSLRKTFDEATSQDLILQLKHDHEILVNTILDATVPKADLIQRVSFLRQWLNEDRITDPKRMVTNEEILKFISGE